MRYLRDGSFSTDWQTLPRSRRGGIRGHRKGAGASRQLPTFRETLKIYPLRFARINSFAFPPPPPLITPLRSRHRHKPRRLFQQNRELVVALLNLASLLHQDGSRCPEAPSDPAERLAPELMQSVLRWLDPEDVVSAGQVSKEAADSKRQLTAHEERHYALNVCAQISTQLRTHCVHRWVRLFQTGGQCH